MSKKIEKIREEIRKEEARIRDMTEHLKTLRMQEKRLEDEEIVRQIRELGGRNTDILDTLRKIQDQKSQNKDHMDPDEQGQNNLVPENGETTQDEPANCEWEEQ